MRFHRFLPLLISCCFASPALAQTGLLRVEIGASRAPETVLKADEAVRAYNLQAAKLTKQIRSDLARAGKYDPSFPFSLPSTVHLVQQGRELPVGGRTRSTDINLIFDTSGAGAFPIEYRNLLKSLYATAKPIIDAIYGAPAVGGDVRVVNFDATIGDRDAVAGGYYLPNDGSGGRQIRFPVYSSPEAAAVNFLHTILLAYQGTTPYALDAFYEGFARAATIRISRIPAAMPSSLDQDLIEQVLENTYDVSELYDWFNQRALGGRRFIATNLRDEPLPVGGSLGGVYLARYQMSGSAWLKLLVEYPTFLAAFNQAFYANPGIAGDDDALTALGQVVLNNLRPGDPTIEGYSFAEWVKRQYILETDDTRGTKLLVQPIPITSGLAGTDFGVFLIQVTYFETQENGNERLLSGTSYPIYWDESFNRMFTEAESEKMNIAGAYGSVVPNFPNQLASAAYRVSIDVPVLDQLQRVYVPAGAIATPASPSPAYIFGTVVGNTPEAGAGFKLRIDTPGGTFTEVPIANGAFSVPSQVGDPLRNTPLNISVIRTNPDTVIWSRRVNKTVGPLALDIRVNGEGVWDFGALQKGIHLLGFPVDPFESFNPEVLGVSYAQTLVARYNSSKARYDLFPDVEPFKVGLGYFVRMPATQQVVAPGRLNSNIAYAVALRPGWNLITTPLPEVVPTSRVTTVRTTEFPRSFAESLGSDLGLDFFTFTRGANDPASGAPETGTFTAATNFAPGVGYLVRCLAPEGLTLLFEPSVGSARSRTWSPPPANPDRWRMKVSFSGSGGTTECFVSQSWSATAGFDRTEDSAIPPGIGGFQVVSVTDQPLYRDARRVSWSQIYSLRADGLRPGQWYTIDLRTETGRALGIQLTNETDRRTFNSGANGVFRFQAKSSTQYFRLNVRGVR